MWTTAEHDTFQARGQRSAESKQTWRPEVLGSFVSSAHTSSSDPGKTGKHVQVCNGAGGQDRVLMSTLTAKALKLSFTAEVECVSGAEPPASMHTFNCQVPAEATARTGHTLQAIRSGSHYTTFYGVVLTVWSAADEQRMQAIRAGLAKENASAPAPEEDSASVFIPYAICLVSVYPLFNALGDLTKAAWLLYSSRMDRHQEFMCSLLEQPAPPTGSKVVLPGPEASMSITANVPFPLPPAHCWIEKGASPQCLAANCNFPIWPFFKTLALEHILTICEVAFTPGGKVLLTSQYESLLSLSVATLQTLVALRQWQGAVHYTCHARDARFYCTDPGSWLIGVRSRLVPSLLLSPEVCIVDLDSNSVTCTHFPGDAPSTGTLRTRRLQHLYAAFPESMKMWNRQAPAKEMTVAFPMAEFRPLSQTEGKGHKPLVPPVWWNAGAVFDALDQAMWETTRSQAFRRALQRTRLIRSPKARRAPPSDHENLRIRLQIEEFVETRDRLEGRIGRLHKRLMVLLNDSDKWRERVNDIQTLVDRLIGEATGLRARLDRERKKRSSLKSKLGQRDLEHVALQAQLKETEAAREEAQAELNRMQETMSHLSHEKDRMVTEMRSLMDGTLDMPLASPTVPSFLGQNSSVSPQGPSKADTQQARSPSDLPTPNLALADPLHHSGSFSNTDAGGLSRLSLPLTEKSIDLEGDAHPGCASILSVGQVQSEVQKRAAIVADQITRIQEQLEDTLTQLEAKRTSLRQRASVCSSSRSLQSSIMSRSGDTVSLLAGPSSDTDQPSHASTSSSAGSSSMWLTNSDHPTLNHSRARESRQSTHSAATDPTVSSNAPVSLSLDPVESMKDGQP